MLTLIVFLAVIALSAAVVVRIVLGEEPKPATPPRQSPRRSPSRHPEEAPAAAPSDVEPASAPSDPVPAAPRRPAEPAPAPAPAPAPGSARPVADDRPPLRQAPAPARHPVRSAVVLVVLLTTVGALLALAVAVALGLLVTGVRAGVG